MLNVAKHYNMLQNVSQPRLEAGEVSLFIVFGFRQEMVIWMLLLCTSNMSLTKQLSSMLERFRLKQTAEHVASVLTRLEVCYVRICYIMI